MFPLISHDYTAVNKLGQMEHFQFKYIVPPDGILLQQVNILAEHLELLLPTVKSVASYRCYSMSAVTIYCQ